MWITWIKSLLIQTWTQVWESRLEAMEAFYVLDESYIDAVLDRAVRAYGSMDAYIREGLGITEGEIANLRQALLESGAPK